MVTLHRCRAGDDLSFSLELVNLTDRPTRVASVRWSFLASGRVIHSYRPGPGFFTDEWLERSARIEARRRVTWSGICLAAPSPALDALRLELELEWGSGLRRRRGAQSLEIPVVPEREPVRVRLPFDGHWRVTQGHACRSTHRLGVGSAELAWDFARVDDRGRLSGDAYDITLRNVDTASFRAPIFAPVDGSVVSVVGDIPDNEGLLDYPRRSIADDLARPRWRFGNSIVIDAGDRVFILLGHLEQGSIAVGPGDAVRRGQPIARCGNSGNSISPHVHVQAMDRADPIAPDVRAVSIRFQDFLEVSSSGSRGDDRSIDARHVGAGEPLEGSIVWSTADGRPRPGS